MSSKPQLAVVIDDTDDARTPMQKLIDAVAQVRKIDNSAERRNDSVAEAKQKVDELREEMNLMMDPAKLLDADGITAMQEKATELKKASEALIKRQEAIGSDDEDRIELIQQIKDYANEL